MRVNSEKVMKILESFAPVRQAQEWDPVGFQIGQSSRPIDKAMVALEVTDAVIDEAIEESVDLLITHHPLLFRPLARLDGEDPISRMAIRLIENRINLIAAHTNLDASPQGTNAYLAEQLGLTRLSNLTDAFQEPLVKLVVFAPVENCEPLVEAMEKAGTGRFGNYAGCTFSTEGQGTFRPLEGAAPRIGQIGELERVREVRIETLVEKHRLPSVLEKVLRIHPYEMPAYDVLPVENMLEKPNMGLVGYLPEPMAFEVFAEEVKRVLGIPLLRVSRAHGRKVNKVALCTGDGTEFIKEAARMGADVYLTGDLKYHQAQEARAIGLSLIDAGHYETEQFYMPRFETLLREKFEQADYDVRVIRSKVVINPFEVV